ncbi:MAG: hypothetical protein NTW74_04080, partial [Acidobacteria bacterium]|nr:hypothetical protein [Acidobacteriota bacterium]
RMGLGGGYGLTTRHHTRDPDHPDPQSNVTHVVGLKCYGGRRPNTGYGLTARHYTRDPNHPDPQPNVTHVVGLER